MNLKKQYRRLFEGRLDFAKANTLKTGDKLLEFTPGREAEFDRADGMADQQEPLDIEYFSDQINEVLTAVEEFHQELGTGIEMKSQETGDFQYDTMEKQVSRYIMGAIKQLEGLQKYLERQKGKL